MSRDLHRPDKISRIHPLIDQTILREISGQRPQADGRNTAVKNGILNHEDADTFDLVHTAMDEFSRSGTEISMRSNSERADIFNQILDTLMVDGTITENQAVIFLAVHDRLVESGLME